MHMFKKLKVLNLLLFLLALNFHFTSCLSQRAFSRFCGKIPIQAPFLSPNSTVTSPLNHMIICKSKKLYFRTSLGLFPISSINYTIKTVTISHPPCSASRHYISPSLLTAGFPIPPKPNSLVLFHCFNKNYSISSFMPSCSIFNGCAIFTKTTQEHHPPSSCLLVNDLEKLDKGFHPKDLNCSHFSQVYRTSSSKDEDDDDDGDDDYEGYELGTRISFDVPDHVPDICDECKKPHGNCGIGLRCICHLQECKDKVISKAALNPFGRNIFPMFSLVVLLISFMNS